MGRVEIFSPFLSISMISTKNIPGEDDIKNIPGNWAFKFYCNLSELPGGKDIKIKSLFNPKDTDPSFIIYYSSRLGKHMFKDFSVNLGGGMVDLVSNLFDLSLSDAAKKILRDYNEYLRNKLVVNTDPIIERTVKITDCIKRTWTTKDAYYWQCFGISSRILNKYKVFPLESYTMEITQGDYQTDKIFRLPQVYGYFKNDDTLYKIYQPKSIAGKFMKLGQYIQGTEQLTFQKPYLIIGSSLKDIMSLEAMNLPIEFISPDSESTMIQPDIINAYKYKYKKIITLFDDDPTGLTFMRKYYELHGIPYLHFQTGHKDVSDTIVAIGQKKTKELLIPQLKKVIHG